jgi:ABC-type glycerol-3-phosphate transport system substrate-binding protein
MLFFTFAFRGNTDQFVDWESGTAYFDSDAFVELLELANTFPPEVDTDSTVPEHDLIAAGRQIMQMNFFNGATDYLRYRTLFGGDLVLKGLPNENRDGNTIVPSTNIAITSSCSDVGTAWEFVRLFLTEDYQRETTLPWMFPVNRVVFEEQINDAMIPRDLSFSNSHTNDVINVKDIKLSQVEADALRDIIENMNRVWIRDAALWIIVSETVESFFNDQITAQEAARIIQSRATIYISEQG